jgi:hypothetical protein
VTGQARAFQAQPADLSNGGNEAERVAKNLQLSRISLELAVPDYVSGGSPMRRSTRFGVFALATSFAAIAAGCNGTGMPDASATASNATETPASAEAARTAAGTPAATDGTRSAVPAETWREVTIPAGTTIPIVLDTAIASDTSRVEDPVRAHLSKPIMVNGAAAVPEGSLITGVVTAAERPGKVKGTGHVAVRFDTLVPEGPGVSDERYRIHTAAVSRTAPTQKKKDALEIGAPAAGGAIVGGIIGGKKGAVIGGAAGGGAGTAVVLNQRGAEARLGKGSALTLRLTEAVTIRVRG